MSMRQPLRILSIEDDPKDAELIQDLLEAEGIVCEVTRVDTQAALESSLHQAGIDLILADYTLPSFDGLSALKLAMKACPEVPFLFVSGTLGEEVAIEALKIGATDYVLKTRLSRLVPSVVRALREAREIAERKQAEENLRRSEAYLAEAQKLSHTGSFGWDVSSGEIFWSQETFRIFGYEPAAKAKIDMVVQRTHPEDRLAVQQLIERVSREKTEFDFEHRLLTPDGAVKYLRVVGRPSKGERGSFEFVGAVTDITESKHAEEALRRSESYLAEGQRLTHTGSWVWQVAGRDALHLSEEWYRLYGFDPEKGPPVWEERLQRVHPEDRSKWQGAIDRAIAETSHYEVEFRILLTDGTVKYIHTVGHPVLNPSGDLVEFVGSSTDITERKRAEESLRQAQADLARVGRVTTMGELTASLAHEVNQPIAAASTNANTCLRWLAGDAPNIEEARAAAMRIVKDVKRAGEIISRVRQLFQKGTSQRELVDVNEIIREMIVLLRGETTRYDILVETDLAVDLPRTMADRVQLQQVLMNLMINSIEAMKDVD